MPRVHDCSPNSFSPAFPRASVGRPAAGTAFRADRAPKRRHLGERLSALLLAALGLVASTAATAQLSPPIIVDHQLEISLDPEAGTLTGQDRLTLPADQPQATVLLHEGLGPRVSDGAGVLERIGRDGHLERYRLITSAPGPVTITYAGTIRHPLETLTEGMGRARQQSIGTIDADGAFLSGYTGWYPRVPESLERFTLTADLPPGWLAVSQGAGPKIANQGNRVRVTWREDHPQDEIYLNAARFKLYQTPGPGAEAQAWLREPDDALAARYLAATTDYLARYSDLIGPYPYAKFALVENFWESGYGMPSFTLLGPTVLRLPFILHTSYPHEILHNWWGNGVFVDYAQGNWSEGLTTYLADHLNAELDGRGADYRRDQLAAWADYVQHDADFPPRAFQGRHGGASQAIGYGKVMMILHMLRISQGDAAFITALRRFYADNRFRIAGWDALEAAFTATSPAAAPELARFFTAWVERPGAPTLTLAEVSQRQLPSGAWQVSGRVEQTQPAAPFPLTVPVVIHDQAGAAYALRVTMDGGARAATFSQDLPKAALRVAVDPAFDSFRTLLPGEAPVRLSTLFGAAGGLIVLPAAAPAPLAAGYRALAEAWVQGQPDWAIATDTGLAALPTDRPVWLLGWENRFAATFAGLGDAGGFRLDLALRTITLAGTDYADATPVLTAGGPDRAGSAALGWLAASDPAALPALARKLPHYGKQGFLVFDVTGAQVLVKGQWPSGGSALVHWFGEGRPTLAVPPRADLLQAEAKLGAAAR